MLNKKDLKEIYNFSERELLKIIKTSGDKIKNILIRILMRLRKQLWVEV